MPVEAKSDVMLISLLVTRSRVIASIFGGLSLLIQVYIDVFVFFDFVIFCEAVLSLFLFMQHDVLTLILIVFSWIR